MLQSDQAPARRPWSFYVLSLAVHAAAVAMLWWLPSGGAPATPLDRARAEAREAMPVRLVSPPPVWRTKRVTHALAAPRSSQPMIKPRERFETPASEGSTEPQRSASVIAAPAAAIAVQPRGAEITWKSQTVELAAPEVREAGFGSAPALPAIDEKRREAVQAGGFGSTEPRNERRSGEAQTTMAGFGTTAQISANRPNRRTSTATAGFGAASADETVAASGHAVRAGTFAVAEQGAPPRPKPAQATGNVESPLRIQSKPKPVYSEVARARGVEGDVRLRVRFRASGAAEVLEIVSGLGFGLDEAATAAARGIQFRPAERDGRPVDTVAIIRITFQTAS